MPNDTIFIDADEELTSVIDKLTASPSQTVLLVVPKGASLLQSVVNLKLLSKEAEKAAKEIALVTSDSVGRNLAAQVGIPVYDDPESTVPIVTPVKPEKPPTEDVIEVDMSGKERPAAPVKVSHYLGGNEVTPAVASPRRKIIFPKKGLIIGLLIFFLALAGLTLLYPRTTIVLGVKSEPYEDKIDITIDKNVTESSEHSSILPGTQITVEKEKTTTATATGKKTVGEKATGTATVYNCYQSVPLTLSKGKVLTSDGKEFLTTEDVAIPAATIVGPSCTTAGQANVGLEAKDVGEGGNLAANSTFCVAGYTCSGGTYVNAKNSTALSGGSSRNLTLLKQEDIDAAVNVAKEELIGETIEGVKSEASSKNLRVLDAALDSQLVDQTSEKEVGAETAESKVTVKVRSRTLAFKEDNYRKLVVDRLALRLPSGKKLLLSTNDEITANVKEANWDQGFVSLEGQVKTNIADSFDEQEIKNKVKNIAVTAAEERLKALPGVSEVTIKTTPQFLARTAIFTRNITVKTEAK